VKAQRGLWRRPPVPNSCRGKFKLSILFPIHLTFRFASTCLSPVCLFICLHDSMSPTHLYICLPANTCWSSCWPVIRRLSAHIKYISACLAVCMSPCQPLFLCWSIFFAGLYIYRPACVSACLPSCLYICLIARTSFSAPPCVCLFVCLPNFLSLPGYVCLLSCTISRRSACLYVWLSAFMSTCLQAFNFTNVTT
jgi:hypothetical protein